MEAQSYEKIVDQEMLLEYKHFDKQACLCRVVIDKVNCPNEGKCTCQNVGLKRP